MKIVESSRDFSNSHELSLWITECMEARNLYIHHTVEAITGQCETTGKRYRCWTYSLPDNLDLIF